jgi:hypothetical protein
VAERQHPLYDGFHYAVGCYANFHPSSIRHNLELAMKRHCL